MKIEDFNLKLGTDEIPWRLFSPDNDSKEYCVLWLQGWTSSMDSHRESVERMSNQMNMAFATLDYAGHGLHKTALEESSRKQQHEEVIAVFDELKKREYGKIIVIGGSFGGYMAALLTGKRPVHTVMLRVPAIYDDSELELPYKQTKRWQNPDAYQESKATAEYIQNNEAVRSITNFDGFTYVLEHELDEQVPKVMPKTYFENAKHGNYLIVPKTTHSPKTMDNPEPYYAYIEHIVLSILEAIKMQDRLD